jgi:CRP-like cAMP-binding protein
VNQVVHEKIYNYFKDNPVVMYPKGHIITLANHEPQGVNLLLDGIVEQYDITPEGNKITVNVFKPPAFFPMSWAINKTPNTFFYATLTEVKAKRAHADETVQFIKDNPDVAFDLLSRVYKGTDALLKRLVLAASDIATNRLTFELLIEAYRFGSDKGDDKTLITVRQTNLAERSGLARETVNRELHKLEHSGLIELTKGGILIDVRQLERKLDVNF